MGEGEHMGIKGLPDDAQVVAITEVWDVGRPVFGVYVESAAFDEIPEGEPIPHLDVTIKSHGKPPGRDR
jgi:hypothetical protein